MVSRGDDLTTPNSTAVTPMHGEGLDRLFQMQKDLGRLEAQHSSIERQFDKMDKRLDAIDSKLASIDKRMYAAGAVITLAVIIIPIVMRIYFP